jgi:hypothetical protein
MDMVITNQQTHTCGEQQGKSPETLSLPVCVVTWLPSPAPNIYTHLKGSGSSPWIGLYNTGKPGRFRWVRKEPLDYTNWGPGEPDNAGGGVKYVAEPYVSLMEDNGHWNDQGSGHRPFIAEFEKPLIRYRKISGPRNGSDQRVGVYTVCYEENNVVSGQKDTCCFKVTVACNPALSTKAASDNAIDIQVPANNSRKELSIMTSPNPSHGSFRLSITSDNNEPMTLQVYDVLGRMVETRNGIVAGQALQIGMRYRPGIYFAQVIQGTKKVTTRLVKQSK